MSILLLWLGLLADGVHWERDYDAAFAKAKERNVPVLLCFNMDGEVASDSTALRLYRDPAFVERSRDFVCLIASTETHETRAEAIGDEMIQACARFGALTCKEHLKVEIRASEEFVGKDSVISPQHVLISPGRLVLARKAYQASLQEIFKMMTMAEKAVSKGVDEDETRRLRELMELARERNSERRDPAIAELGGMANVEARDFLFDLTEAREMAATRVAAIDALAQKGNYDALPILTDLLKDKSVQIVQHAIVAIEHLELPAAVPTLLKMWKRKPKTVLAKELPRALAKSSPHDERVREAILKELKRSKDQQVELATIVAAAELPDEDGEILARLEKKLGDRNGNVRGITVWVLGATKRKEAEPLLRELLEKDSNAEVRECIEAALRNMALEGKEEDAAFVRMFERFVTDDIER